MTPQLSHDMNQKPMNLVGIILVAVSLVVYAAMRPFSMWSAGTSHTSLPSRLVGMTPNGGSNMR